MVNITQTVTSNHSKMSLQIKKETIDFNISVFKLYLMFLKREVLFSKLYTSSDAKDILNLRTLKHYPFRISVSDLSLTNTHKLLCTRYNTRDSLVYSQLWRGFVLDNIDKIDGMGSYELERLKETLISTIQLNYKSDYRIKKIIEKWTKNS